MSRQRFIIEVRTIPVNINGECGSSQGVAELSPIKVFEKYQSMIEEGKKYEKGKTGRGFALA